MAQNGSERILYEIFSSGAGWGVFRQSQLLTVSETQASAIESVHQLVQGASVVCEIVIHEKDGEIKTRYCCFSPARSAEKHQLV